MNSKIVFVILVCCWNILFAGDGRSVLFKNNSVYIKNTGSGYETLISSGVFSPNYKYVIYFDKVHTYTPTKELNNSIVDDVSYTLYRVYVFDTWSTEKIIDFDYRDMFGYESDTELPVLRKTMAWSRDDTRFVLGGEGGIFDMSGMEQCKVIDCSKKRVVELTMRNYQWLDGRSILYETIESSSNVTLVRDFDTDTVKSAFALVKWTLAEPEGTSGDRVCRVVGQETGLYQLNIMLQDTNSEPEYYMLSGLISPNETQEFIIHCRVGRDVNIDRVGRSVNIDRVGRSADIDRVGATMVARNSSVTKNVSFNLIKNEITNFVNSGFIDDLTLTRFLDNKKNMLIENISKKSIGSKILVSIINELDKHNTKAGRSNMMQEQMIQTLVDDLELFKEQYSKW
jgi:hypothetical protein